MTIPEQAVEDAIGEICADCGKEIGMLDASYYRPAAPGADFGKTYHSTCGDPFGIKAKDAEIERCHKEIARLNAALPLVGVQRPEDVARIIRQYKFNVGLTSDMTCHAIDAANIAAAVLALPHTGQLQEGQTRTFTFPADLKPKWIDRFMKDVQAHIRGIQDTSNETYPAPHHGWICFHCGERFTTEEGAAIHFGTVNDERPVCAAPASPRAEGE